MSTSRDNLIDFAEWLLARGHMRDGATVSEMVDEYLAERGVASALPDEDTLPVNTDDVEVLK